MAWINLEKVVFNSFSIDETKIIIDILCHVQNTSKTKPPFRKFPKGGLLFTN